MCFTRFIGQYVINKIVGPVYCSSLCQFHITEMVNRYNLCSCIVCIVIGNFVLETATANSLTLFVVNMGMGPKALGDFTHCYI